MRQRALLLARGGGDHPARAELVAELDGKRADAPGRRRARRRSPAATRPAVRYRCQAVVPWIIIASAVPSSRPVGDRENELARAPSRTRA